MGKLLAFRPRNAFPKIMQRTTTSYCQALLLLLIVLGCIVHICLINKIIDEENLRREAIRIQKMEITSAEALFHIKHLPANILKIQKVGNSGTIPESLYHSLFSSIWNIHYPQSLPTAIADHDPVETKLDRPNGKHSDASVMRPQWDRIKLTKSTGYYSFNATASDQIPVDRDIPDTRPNTCRDKKYEVSRLPNVSVIIPCHNEGWSTLLRTLHSVLQRTPPELLVEIIIIEDASTYPYLQDPLDDYVKVFPKIRLVRMPERVGLIRARLHGARLATGTVLFIMDSHVEVNRGWLEPVLARIQTKREAVIIPTMDLINSETFRYTSSRGIFYGSFNWNLIFTWTRIPETVSKVMKTPTDPIPTPVMVGCAFGIDRGYFFEIGAYDESMEIWGGENVEHSFRIWMCGGVLETLPCSRVGHVFKPRLPFSFAGDPKKVIMRNMIRVAEVWMDEYKDIYYATLGERAKEPVDLDALYRRKALRRDLECQSFEWYLRNVMPDVSVPVRGDHKFGYLRHYWSNNLCVQYKGPREYSMTDCSEQVTSEQGFHINSRGNFMFYDRCFSVGNQRDLILGHACNDSGSAWLYDDYLIMNTASNLCLSYRSQHGLILEKCDHLEKDQKWSFKYEFDWRPRPPIEGVVGKFMTKPPSAVYFGQLHNQGRGKCLWPTNEKTTFMKRCDTQPIFDRILHLDKDMTLRFRHLCLVVRSLNHGSGNLTARGAFSVNMAESAQNNCTTLRTFGSHCVATNTMSRCTTQLVDVQSQLCLQASLVGDFVTLSNCRLGFNFQMWTFIKNDIHVLSRETLA